VAEHYRYEQVKETKDMVKFVHETLPKDVRTTIKNIFAIEVEGQARLGQKPQSMLIDGKRNQLDNVQRKAQAIFSDPVRVMRALEHAWDQLIKRTRYLNPVDYWPWPPKKEPGTARKSYALYLNGKPVGERGDIQRVVEGMGPQDRISIVGPGVAYGRKMYWRPAGKARKIKKKRGHFDPREGTKVHGTYDEPIHRYVMRLIQRQFRDLYVADNWVELRHFVRGYASDRVKLGTRWPAITIGPKWKGRVH